jgi:hypothetical protein
VEEESKWISKSNPLSQDSVRGGGPEDQPVSFSHVMGEELEVRVENYTKLTF